MDNPYKDINTKVMVTILNGFINSTITALETMAFTKASRSGIYLKEDGQEME